MLYPSTRRTRENHIPVTILCWQNCSGGPVSAVEMLGGISWRRWPYNSLQGILRASERVLCTCVRSGLHMYMRNARLHKALLYALRLCFPVDRIPPYSREKGRAEDTPSADAQWTNARHISYWHAPYSRTNRNAGIRS